MPAGIGEGDVVFVVTVENATAAGLMAARTDINRATNQIAGDVGSNFANVGNMVKGVEESFRRLGNTLVGAGGAITGTFTLPLVLGLRSLIDAGVDFETEIQRVVSLFATAETPIANTKKEVIEFSQAMALTSQYSATEVTKAMYMMGQAGYELTDVYKAIPNILELATAQQYEVAGTFDIVNTVLKSYQMTADDSRKVTNMLASAATEFNLTMADYDKGLKYVLGTSRSLDMELSEMLVTFGMLTDRGYTGMQAGRILRDTIADLIAPVGKSTDLIQKYNLQLYSNSEEINGVANAYNAAQYRLEMMQRGTSGTTEELARLNYTIQQNENLIARSKLAGNTENVQYLTLANQDLKETYSMLSAGARVTNAEIASQQSLVNDLEKAMSNTTIKGLVPFRDIIKQIANSGMTAGEIYELFGKQSGGAIIALTDLYRTNNKVFDEYIAKIESSRAAEEQAAIQKQSTAFQVKQLREAIDQLRVAGYMALAPVIQVINEFLLKNMDTLKMLAKEFIEGFVPALQRIFGVFQTVINWFANMDEGARKMLFRIAAGGIVFMAAVGPILLYVGSIAWAVASFLKLGRGIADVIVGVLDLIVKFLGLTIAEQSATVSLIEYNAAVAITETELLALNPSLVTTGSAFGFVETTAIGASGAMAGIGTAIMTILPYLAIAGVVIYALYFAWKNNWGGMATATSEAAQLFVGTIDNEIRPAIGRLKEELGQIKEGTGGLIQGLIDADPYQISYAMGKLAGGIGAAARDLDYIWDGIGVAIMKSILVGLAGGDAKATFEKEMKDIIDITKMGEAAWAGWTEGFTGGTFTQINKQLVTTDKGVRDFQNSYADSMLLIDNSTGALDKATDNTKKYHMAVSNLTPTFAGFNTTQNQTIKGFGNISDEVNKAQVRIFSFNTTPLKNPLGTNTTNAKFGTDAGSILIGSFNDTIAKNLMGGIDLTSSEEIVKQAFGDIGAEAGTAMGEETVSSFSDIINSPEIQKMMQDAVSGTVPSFTTTPTAPMAAPGPKAMTAKEAFGKYWDVDGAYYEPATINAIVAGQKSYDGEYPSLKEMLKKVSPMAYTPEGVPKETPVAPAAAATTAATNIAAAMAPVAGAVGGAVTNIANQFNINTYVYPKAAMDTAEINALGDQITKTVETKLGEKYRADGAT